MEYLSVCRICLNKDVHHVVKNLQLQETYEILTRLPFQSNMRPLAVCYICYAQLRASLRFKLKCLRAEQLLAQMLDQRPAGDEVQDPILVKQSLNELSFSAIEKTIIIGSDLEDVDKVTIEIMYRNDEGIEEQNSEAASIAETYTLKPDPVIVKVEASESNGDDDNKDPLLNDITDISIIHKNDVLINNDNYQQKNENCNDGDRKHNLRKRHVKNICLPPKVSFVCDVCEKKCNGKSNLIYHIRTHHVEDKPFVCNLCPKGFIHKSKLVSHVRKHEVAKSICVVCKRKFYKRIHNMGDKEYVCDVGAKGFCNSNQLENHTSTHTGEKPYVCKMCEYHISKKSTLMTPSSKQHAPPVHKTKRAYICDICGQSFNLKHCLLKHVLLHTGVRPYVCKVCNKSFTSSSNLYSHSRIHTGLKPHVCSVCGRAFTHSLSLRTHSRIHTGEKPYVCEVCGKCFRASHGLQLHSRTHTGERPYVCDTCGKGFNTKSNLIVHLRLHSAGKVCVSKKPAKCASDSHIEGSVPKTV